MPTPLLHEGATVLCAHGGRAEPLDVSPRVALSGEPVSAVPGRYVVVGCSSENPCPSATFGGGTRRVRAGGSPILLASTPSVSVPTGAGLQVVRTQARVVAS